ncbi:MAG: hypothetical protein FIA97_03675, partial [Methylococcaceae bacterium]|nr:hypothetical protein [Methylococcaceae bacterium]
MFKRPPSSSNHDLRRGIDWPSFRKTFAALGVLITAGTGLTLWIELEGSFNQEAIAEKARIERRVSHVSVRIADILSDLRLIAGAPALQRYLDAEGAVNIVEVQQEFAVFVEAKQIYDQARYIDETGMERVRVDLSAGKAKIIADEKLQPKSSRYYFTDAIKLAQGAVYISPLDLNIEGTQVEIPYKPLIRLATPLFDGKGQRRGIAIINYLGKDLLQRLDGLKDPGSQGVELLNREGYWLKSASPDLEWGFMFKRGETFATRYPTVWQWLQESPSGQRMSDRELWTWSRIYPLRQDLQSSSGTPEASGPSQAGLTASDYYWIALSHTPSGWLVPSRRNELVRYGL